MAENVEHPAQSVVTAENRSTRLMIPLSEQNGKGTFNALIWSSRQPWLISLLRKK